MERNFYAVQFECLKNLKFMYETYKDCADFALGVVYHEVVAHRLDLPVYDVYYERTAKFLRVRGALVRQWCLVEVLAEVVRDHYDFNCTYNLNRFLDNCSGDFTGYLTEHGCTLKTVNDYYYATQYRDDGRGEIQVRRSANPDFIITRTVLDRIKKWREQPKTVDSFPYLRENS
ncbi:ORF25 [Ranid herpesvirus 2]|uniref:ORF25 n=1 Tax=Ranid herpesvirus 2 TaxID=389214 RepID=Q14W81_9VIRU|nr:ORF25 [Ranid herpesvirus 2]ABG25684.1 ORF25 [Ranid herpesvirus 2]